MIDSRPEIEDLSPTPHPENIPSVHYSNSVQIARAILGATEFVRPQGRHRPDPAESATGQSHGVQVRAVDRVACASSNVTKRDRGGCQSATHGTLAGAAAPIGTRPPSDASLPILIFVVTIRTSAPD
jgi:hypothetical protein